MKCPACNADAMVRETRARENNITSRRYECFNGHRFTTTEIAVRVDLEPVKRSGRARLPAMSVKGISAS